ncbi:MAG: M28 family peptidase [Cyclobacteriaceae bacterium]
MKKWFLLLSLAAAFFHVDAQFSFDSAILIQHVKTLSSDAMEGRKTGTEGGKKARAYIIDELKKIGVAPFVPNYSQPFTVKPAGVAGNNILAVIPGKLAETIIISAHYDHLGIRNNIIFNGADDNASGVAALLSLAQYFTKHPPHHRLIFAFFDAEEMGLQGSSFFVNTVNLEGEKTILNINLDMVSRSDKNELYACGGYHAADVQKRIEQVKPPDGFVLRFGHDNPALGHNDWTSQSDHFSFHQKKIPFVYFGVEDHPDYHRATDDFEKINRLTFSKSVETILSCINMLDQ